MSRPRVIVAGLGDTGVLSAVFLAHDVDVVGITTKLSFVSGQELGMRIARPDSWMRDYRIAYNRFRGLDSVRIVHGRTTDLDTSARTVGVEHADGSRTEEPYDAVVIATGVTNGFWRQPTVQHDTDIDDDLASAHSRIAQARSVAIVGGGAAATGCAAQIAERWPEKNVHLYFPGTRGLPHHHRRTWRRVEIALTALGVELHAGHRAVLPPSGAPQHLTDAPVVWCTDQEPTHVDVVVWAIGKVRANTNWLPAEMLDEDGFVRVGSDLRLVGHDNIFAVGDVAATDRLRTSARNQGHKLLAHNVKAHLNGAPLRSYRPPARRWGSVLGPRRDGLVVFSPNGRGFRFPAYSLGLLQRVAVHRGIYRGVRKNRTE